MTLDPAGAGTLALAVLFLAAFGVSLALGLRLRSARSAAAELAETTRSLGTVLRERTALLRRAERKYHALLGQANLGILLWDPTTLRILEANARVAELLGLRPRDLVGSPLETLFPLTERENSVRALRGVTRVGRLRLAEVPLLAGGGGPCSVELSASLVRFGSESAVLGIVRDLKESKALEQRSALISEQIRRTDKEAAIGQLAAGVAHEINNPMGYVASNVNRMLEYSKRLVDLIGRDSGSRASHAEELHDLVGELEAIAEESREGVARVVEIVQALREFSHGGPGRETLEWADLNNVVRNCLTLVAHHLRGRAEVELDLQALPRVRCHPMQIAQVVMNLLVNAGQAIRPPGRIRISTHDSGDRVHIAVEDDGEGISEDHLPQIFDPFFTTKAIGQGTGLGLAVSAEILRQHGGGICVDSWPGRGARFLIELRRDGPPTGRATPTEPGDDGGRSTSRLPRRAAEEEW
ncbi:MAG: nitrogen regulation protein NR(II) [Myxococcota bacterium]